MVGGLFAGTKETPARGKLMFRGMASSSAQLEHRGVVSNGVAEGSTFRIEEKGSVEEIVKQLVGGLRSAMSYSNSIDIATFHDRATFMEVSNSTQAENRPHFKYYSHHSPF
jgi:IMP dehydrogenase